jgi:DNA (cytosine-5)-methyltransferase 1
MIEVKEKKKGVADDRKTNNTKYKFAYEWTLEDAKFTKDKGTVFSCFACGGGSTMGYKLAGFDVIGMNEIDERLSKAYIENHNPKFPFIEDIRTFKNRNDLPKELYNLDILDGSPPCSSFSMAGNREKDWGKEKHFREGQIEQVLDTLFFDFIELAEKLQPKIVIAENVKGILMGDAKEYAKKILEDFDKAGYVVTEFLLNANRMGVPQKRERVFFIAIRKDLAPKLPQNISVMFNEYPILDLVFFEPIIKFGKIKDSDYKDEDSEMTDHKRNVWNKREFGDLDFSCTLGRTENRPNSMFNNNYIYEHKVLNTITSKKNNVLMSEPRHLNFKENMRGASFPKDYNFLGMPYRYLLGMSVPPIMTAQIASRIYECWLSKLVT